MASSDAKFVTLIFTYLVTLTTLLTIAGYADVDPVNRPAGGLDSTTTQTVGGEPDFGQEVGFLRTITCIVGLFSPVIVLITVIADPLECVETIASADIPIISDAFALVSRILAWTQFLFALLTFSVPGIPGWLQGILVGPPLVGLAITAIRLIPTVG